MNYPKVLSRFPELVGQHFQPSNGTEGMIFMEAFCENCLHDCPDEEGKKCDIILESLLGEQPTEWQYSSEGWPICTKWQKWDWDNDGDPDDPNNPKAPTPIDEKQLCIPFSVYELLGITEGVCVTAKGIFETEIV